MGTGLADGVSQGDANGREFRTAPLWGVGQRIFFLHDGRTNDLAEVIRQHASRGSEANEVVQNYNLLSTDDKQALLNYLRSLWAVSPPCDGCCAQAYCDSASWGGLAWRYGAVLLPFGAVTSQMPNPEDGKVANATYANAYFGLSYPLPQGWAEGEVGPDPSHSGYYVLGTLVPERRSRPNNSHFGPRHVLRRQAARRRPRRR